jgi:Na+/phosphate symporter
MSAVNRRILETLEKSNYSNEVKELIKTLLMIELKHAGDKVPRYAEDYDRNIKRLAKFKETDESENEEIT